MLSQLINLAEWHGYKLDVLSQWDSLNPLQLPTIKRNSIFDQHRIYNIAYISNAIKVLPETQFEK